MMASSSNLGIIWAVVLCLIVLITHLQLRGVWSLIALVGIVVAAVVVALLGLWDSIIQAIQIFDIHITTFGYLSISLFLFVIWLVTFLVYDRLVYMVFSRGQLRVRMKLGEGEKVFDTRGMVIEKHQNDLFRHWLLGIGSGDHAVRTAGPNPQQFEMPNVLFIGHKLTLVNKMLQEREVFQAR